MQIDLSNTELFKNLIEIESFGTYIDLHNEFECQSIVYTAKASEFILSFVRTENFERHEKQVEIVFSDISIQMLSLKIESDNLSAFAIDQIYRGRFLIGDDTLGEITEDGKVYFYIIFYGDYLIELFTKKVTANIF